MHSWRFPTCDLTPDNHRVTLVDCGNCDLLRVGRRTGMTERLLGSNVPLGFAGTRGLQTGVVSYLQRRRHVFVHSDGVTEARDSAGDFYGEERLAQLLSTSRLLTADQITETVSREVMDFRGSQSLADDPDLRGSQDCEQLTASRNARSDPDNGWCLGSLRRRQILRETTMPMPDLIPEAEFEAPKDAVGEAVNDIIRDG